MVIKTSEPKVLLKLKCILGEGILWVKEHNAIYFVDIKKHKTRYEVKEYTNFGETFYIITKL